MPPEKPRHLRPVPSEAVPPLTEEEQLQQEALRKGEQGGHPSFRRSRVAKKLKVVKDVLDTPPEEE